MKVEREHGHVDSNMGNGQRLTITATPEAMQILSKGIYSRPLEACIREICTNAYDAHAMIGCAEKPFIVELPTWENQNLTVRDYGPGIPADKMVDIFATYFNSSKQDSDVSVGCFGLGSKSPLAVSDQFIVEVWNSGFYYLWNIYKDDDGYVCIPEGKPSIQLPSVEPTGVKITVPVTDIRQARETAMTVLQWFTTPPTVIQNGQTLQVPKRTIIKKYKHFTIEEGSGIYAWMGNVVYPIDVSVQGLERYGSISDKKIVIPFEIGDIFPSASRETLNYNKTVVAVLIGKLNLILDELAEEFQAEINHAKHPIRAAFLYHNSALKFAIRQTILPKLQFNGKLLTSYFDEKTLSRSNCLPSPPKTTPPTPHKHYEFMQVIQGYKNSYYVKTQIYLQNQNTLYYVDNPKEKACIRRIAATNFTGCAFLLPAEGLDEWLKVNYLTKNDLIPISSLPKISYTRGPITKRTKKGIFRIVGGRYQNAFWAEIPDANQLGNVEYYVIKKGDKYLINGHETFTTDWNDMASLGFFPKNIYGVPEAEVKNFPNWIPLETYVKQKFDAVFNDICFAMSNRDFNTKITKYLSDSFGNQVALIQKYSSYWNYISFAKFFNLKEPQADKKLAISTGDIYKKYPMLKITESYGYSSSAYDELLKKYIEDMDELYTLKENKVV